MTATQRSTGAARVPVRVDAQRWPDIAVVPNHPVRAAIARKLFRHAVARVPLRVIDPDHNWTGGGTGTDPVMRLVRPDAFFHRLGDSGTIGLGEAYMAGDWDTDDLPGVLAAFAAQLRDLIPPTLHL